MRFMVISIDFTKCLPDFYQNANQTQVNEVLGARRALVTPCDI